MEEKIKENVAGIMDANATREPDVEKIKAEAIELKAKYENENKKVISRVYPILVYGRGSDEKPFYVGYFMEPDFKTFSKYLSLGQQDQVSAMRTLANDCFIGGDKEVVLNDSLFIYGLMPSLNKIIEARESTVINL